MFKEVLTCPKCKRMFVARTASRKICKTCMPKEQMANNPNKKCKICGKRFVSDIVNACLCSDKCRKLRVQQVGREQMEKMREIRRSLFEDIKAKRFYRLWK